jgi:hypothetical protein
MASKTDIVNFGLIALGEERVSNVDTDNSKPTRVMSELYSITRDAMLCNYPWNFSIKRAAIPASLSAPAWGYSKAFPLPSDFLSLLYIKDNVMDYSIEAGGILCNEAAPLYIKYIAKITDETVFDPIFCKALGLQLGLSACEAITQSSTKKQIIAAELQEVVSSAYANNIIQNPNQILNESEWVESRYAYDPFIRLV